MFFTAKGIALLAAALLVLNPSTLQAQIPAGVTNQVGGAAQAAGNGRNQTRLQQQVQAQVQQRLQANVQQQVQAQIQAQAQARLQAEAARAVSIAQRAAAASRQAAAAAGRRANDRPQINGSAHAKASARGRRDNQSSTAAARGNAAFNTDTTLPPGLSEEDLKLYDGIFGRFNPFRPQAEIESHIKSDVRATARASETPAADRIGARFLQASHVQTENDLETRINLAVNQRRAEISQVRDRALNSADVKLMERAEHMEQVLNAFVAAQAQANANANARFQADGTVQGGNSNATLRGRGTASGRASSGKKR